MQFETPAPEFNQWQLTCCASCHITWVNILPTQIRWKLCQLPSIKSGTNEKEKKDSQKLIILVNKWIESNIATNHRRMPMIAPKPSVWIYTGDLGFISLYRREHCRGPSLLRLQRTECVWETEHVGKYIYLSIYLCASVKACRDSHVVLFIFILGRSGLLSGTGWSGR